VTQPNRADNRLLRLNVGFLLKEGAGYTREFTFDEPLELRVEDVTIHHLEGRLRLTRTPQGILVQGSLNAKTPVACVRCLTPVDADIDFPFEELFVPPTSPQANNPDTKDYVIDEGGYIDLTPIIREEGIVAVPIQVLCREDCKGLCPQCGQNWNEGTCDCAPDDIDSRLASLRSLLKDSD
jgi:uncharacterized protein